MARLGNQWGPCRRHPVPCLPAAACPWSPWSPWSRCSCQAPRQHRHRHRQGPAGCAGLDVQSRPCNTSRCSGERQRCDGPAACTLPVSCAPPPAPCLSPAPRRLQPAYPLRPAACNLPVPCVPLPAPCPSPALRCLHPACPLRPAACNLRVLYVSYFLPCPCTPGISLPVPACLLCCLSPPRPRRCLGCPCPCRGSCLTRLPRRGQLCPPLPVPALRPPLRAALLQPAASRALSTAASLPARLRLPAGKSGQGGAGGSGTGEGLWRGPPWGCGRGQSHRGRGKTWVLPSSWHCRDRAVGVQGGNLPTPPWSPVLAGAAGAGWGLRAPRAVRLPAPRRAGRPPAPGCWRHGAPGLQGVVSGAAGAVPHEGRAGGTPGRWVLTHCSPPACARTGPCGAAARAARVSAEPPHRRAPALGSSSPAWPQPPWPFSLLRAVPAGWAPLCPLPGPRGWGLPPLCPPGCGFPRGSMSPQGCCR